MGRKGNGKIQQNSLGEGSSMWASSHTKNDVDLSSIYAVHQFVGTTKLLLLVLRIPKYKNQGFFLQLDTWRCGYSCRLSLGRCGWTCSCGRGCGCLGDGGGGGRTCSWGRWEGCAAATGAKLDHEVRIRITMTIRNPGQTLFIRTQLLCDI